MKNFQSTLTLLFALLLVQAGLSSAEEKKERVITLDEIVVTATKMEKKIKDVPASVYVITEEDIKQTDARNIEEVLQKVPGVFTEDKYHIENGDY